VGRSTSTTGDTMAGAGASSLAALEKLKAEKAKLATKAESSSRSAASASKIASIKASSVARQETSVDLCIAMDCTGSMGAYIAEAKEKMATVVEKARAKFDIELRVAFVGYRDFCDKVRFETKDFVGADSIGEVTQLLRGCQATGGGDAPEDVAGGLQKAVGMSWKSNIKMLVHVADAPAHGSEYHDGLGDNHDGPQTPDPADMMRQLGQMKVAYYFFKINSSTDKMIGKLKEAHKNSRREFKVCDFSGDVTMFEEMLLGSVASSVRDAGLKLPTSSSSLASPSKSASLSSSGTSPSSSSKSASSKSASKSSPSSVIPASSSGTPRY